MLDLHGHHPVLVLEHSVHDDERLPDERGPVGVEHVGGDDAVGDARLVLQAQEQEPLRGPGTLAADHRPRHLHAQAGGQVEQVHGPPHAAAPHLLAAMGHGMGADGEAGVAVVGLQALLGGHGGQG